MAHQTIRDSERLTKLSEGKCDLDDVDGIIERVVAASAMALTGCTRPASAKNSEAPALPARRAERLRN
jgi:hypothetical protein